MLRRSCFVDFCLALPWLPALSEEHHILGLHCVLLSPTGPARVMLQWKCYKFEKLCVRKKNKAVLSTRHIWVTGWHVSGFRVLKARQVPG